MFPVLFSLGPITIRSYGLMIAIGALIAVWMADAKAAKAGVAKEDFVFSMGIVSLIGGFIGAKLLFWITILPDFLAHPLTFIRDFPYGFVVYGGLIGGILTAWLYCRIKGENFFACFDIAAPYIALAQCFGRIGCFLEGCCYGKSTESSLGVIFNNSIHAPLDEKLFPIQLVCAALNLVNFLFLSYLWEKRTLKRGAVGIMYIITYSIGRFVIEFFRGDIERGSVGIFSTSQFISIFTGIFGIALLIIRCLYYGGAEKK